MELVVDVAAGDDEDDRLELGPAPLEGRERGSCRALDAQCPRPRKSLTACAISRSETMHMGIPLRRSSSPRAGWPLAPPSRRRTSRTAVALHRVPGLHAQRHHRGLLRHHPADAPDAAVHADDQRAVPDRHDHRVRRADRAGAGSPPLSPHSPRTAPARRRPRRTGGHWRPRARAPGPSTRRGPRPPGAAPPRGPRAAPASSRSRPRARTPQPACRCAPPPTPSPRRGCRSTR